MKLRNLALLFIGLLVAVNMVSCSDDSSSSEFEILRAHIETLNANGGLYKLVPASDVMTNKGNTTDYQIIDVRGTTGDADGSGSIETDEKPAYAEGYITNAVNIGWTAIADNLATVSSTKTVYVHCYTSNTGGFASTILNILGYNSYNMKWGMMGYNEWDKVTGTGAGDDIPDDQDGYADIFSTGDYAVSTAAVATGEYSYPEIATGNSSATDIAAARYPTIATGRFISAADVKIIADGQTAGDATVTISSGDVNPSDYQIVSVRAADYYAGTGGTNSDEGGHIPNAINIPTGEIANKAYLKMLDPTKTQIVYCYTGHTGSIATAVLSLLGYNAYNMKFGMAAWTSAATVNKGYTFSGAPDNSGGEYDLD